MGSCVDSAAICVKVLLRGPPSAGMGGVGVSSEHTTYPIHEQLLQRGGEIIHIGPGSCRIAIADVEVRQELQAHLRNISCEADDEDVLALAHSQ